MPDVDPSPRVPTGGSPESVSEAAEIAADEGVVALDTGAPGRSVRDGFRALRYPGYRIYFAQKGKVLLLLLCGGDKSTQSRDIAKARRLLAEFSRE